MGRRERNKWRNGPTRRLEITPTMRGEMSHILLIHGLKMGAILYSHLSVLILTRHTSSDAVACASQPTYARENFPQSHRILSLPLFLFFILYPRKPPICRSVNCVADEAACRARDPSENRERRKVKTRNSASRPHARARAHGVPLQLGHISIFGKLFHVMVILFHSNAESSEGVSMQCSLSHCRHGAGKPGTDRGGRSFVYFAGRSESSDEREDDGRGRGRSCDWAGKITGSPLFPSSCRLRPRRKK